MSSSHRFFSALALLAATVSLSGCFPWPTSDDGEVAPPNRDGTLLEPADNAGELGHLRFGYSSLEMCTFGCGMGREVLAGSEVDVLVEKADPRITYEVKSSAPDIAPMTIKSRCNGGSSNSNGSSCSWTIKVDTKKSGDVKLEMINTATNVVDDRITIKIRDASTLESTISVTEPGRPAREVKEGPDGKVEVKIDSAIAVTSKAKSIDGTELLFVRGAFGIRYSNDRVVGPSEAFNLFGRSATEEAQASTVGDATLTVSAGPAKRDIAFRVVR